MINSAFLPADILLPNSVDMTKWTVIACDQFSSERDYWERVKAKVGDNPSTLKLIVPEAYLDTIDPVVSAREIGAQMQTYLEDDLFRTIADSYIYIERILSDGVLRRGLIGKLDLETYDYTPGSAAVVRASEKTIVARLPARIEIRKLAPIELPHIMALIDDEAQSIIEPISDITPQLEQLYNFDLMEGGGAITGWRVTDLDAQRVSTSLSNLFENKSVQLIIGDGNHSLAAAKGYWDTIKSSLDDTIRSSHPARFALLEINNVYDPAIDFEAIHRLIMTDDTASLVSALRAHLADGQGCTYELHWSDAEGSGSIEARASGIGELIKKLQTFLDDRIDRTGDTIDYIHDSETLVHLSKKDGCLGLLLPAMDKAEFFSTVIDGGVFPKKSFSIGHARDKRYYLDSRTIRL